MAAGWHRVGLERPHFCTRFPGQSESWFAPAQQEPSFGTRGENLAEALPQHRRKYFSVGNTLILHRAGQANRGQSSHFSEAEMAEHTDHKLTHHSFHRSELGSVDADFLHRADQASSFLRTLLRSQGEERFTPVLHGGLHRSLHRSTAGKGRQVNQIEVPKPVAPREDWHDVRAGATPPFDARCVTVACGRSRPQRNFVSAFCSVAFTGLRVCQTKGMTLCMNTKGEARCLY